MGNNISETQIAEVKKKLEAHLKRTLNSKEYDVFQAFIKKKNIVKSDDHAKPIAELAENIQKLVAENASVKKDDWTYTIWSWKF